MMLITRAEQLNNSKGWRIKPHHRIILEILCGHCQLNYHMEKVDISTCILCGE